MLKFRPVVADVTVMDPVEILHVGCVTEVVGAKGTKLTVAVTAVLPEIQPVEVFLDWA